MSEQLELSSAEEEYLASLFAALSQEAKRTLSLTQLLDGWQRLVTQVEQGYEDSIYEYTNDLSVRDLLDQVLLQAPQTLRSKILVRIEPWDDRFRAATVSVERPIAPGKSSQRWQCIPRRFGSELERDLRFIGLLG